MKALLGEARCAAIEGAPLIGGFRHPTWFALQPPGDRPADHLVDEAIRRISSHLGGEAWLADLVPRLTDFQDSSNSSSALAEIRAYGALLEAGFEVSPLPRSKTAKSPDFSVDAGDGRVIVEVFAKHQDHSQDAVVDAIHSPPGSELPPGIERSTYQQGAHSIIVTAGFVAPFGEPNPSKPGDSIQANAVQRLCGVKSNEKQLPADAPVLLIVDFMHLGGPHMSSLVSSDEASPVSKGHRGLSCGPLWYAMFGWKGAPLFEELSHRPATMAHDGRFRLTGNQKSKLSAVLAVFSHAAVLLENPWATHPLPSKTRHSLLRYPWFDLSRSIADWFPGATMRQVEIHRELVNALGAVHAEVGFLD